MNTTALTTLIISVLFLSGCQSTGSAARHPITVSGLEDVLESNVMIHSMNYDLSGTNPFGGLVYPNRHDFYLREYVDKESGQVSSQLYVRIRVPEDTRWDTLTYLVDGDRRSSTGREVSAESICFQGCQWLRDIVFPLDRRIIEYWAAQENTITLRVSSTGSTDRRDLEMDPEEARKILDERQSVIEQL